MKTKWQLNLGVPAGFRRENTTQSNYRHHVNTLLASPPVVDPMFGDPISSDPLCLHSNSTLTEPLTSSAYTQDDPTILPPLTSQVQIPILRCVDKPSSSLPSRLTFTEDSVRENVGFRRIDTIKRHFRDLYQDTIIMDSLPCDAVLDPGDLATLHKSPRNTSPAPRPSQFGDTIHMDIVFGPAVALGDTHYGLIFVDRFSRMTYLYPLQNLTTDIKKQLDAFFCTSWFSSKMSGLRF